MYDILRIGYDYSNEKSHTCLIIGRQCDRTGRAIIIKKLYDKEAEEIYNKLTNIT